MSERQSLPDVAESALRSHHDEEAVERIWQRLEQDLSTAPGRPRSALWWAPAAMVIIFGSGVFVGARWARPAAPVAAVAAEPLAPPDQERATQAPGAGAAEGTAGREKIARRAPEHTPVVHRPHSVLALPGTPEVAAPAPVIAAPPDWQRLANNGDWVAARKALDAQGGFDAAMQSASAEQLMTLADIARFAKPVQTAAALAALRRVLARFPGDPNAPVAAYTLGNMLDRAGDRAGAAQAFAAYRSLSPKGDFAEDALAREVEVAVEQGDLERAKQLADQYAEDFPKGRRRAEIRAELAKLAGDAGIAAAGDGGTATDDPADEPEDEDPSAAARSGDPAR